MRICILIKATLAHHMGGMQVHCEKLAKGFARRGHPVTILTTRHPDGKTQSLKDGGVETVFLEAASGRDSLEWKSASAAYVGRRRADFDVVYSQSFAAAGLARLKGRACPPIVCCVHGFWAYYLLDQWQESETLFEHLRWLLIKAPESYGATLLFEWPCIRASRRIIAIAHYLEMELRQRYGVAQNSIAYVPYGLPAAETLNDEQRAAVRRELGVDAKAFLFCMSSALVRQKGVQHAIDAAKRARVKRPEIALVVAGDGPYAAALKRLAAGERGVVFTGALPNEKVRRLLCACNAFLYPTLRREGVPLAIIEAAASGLPVVASDIGGVADIVEDGVNGFLCRPADVDAVAAKVEALAAEPAKAARMGARGLDRWKALFNEERMVEETLRVLESVLT